jgi:hypothetical protein
MTTLLSINDKDNTDFISNAEIIIQDRIEIWNPFILGVIKIDNWFDDKWLNFSGDIMPGLTIWKDEITIPPFHPNRVLSTDFYRRLRLKGEYQKLHDSSPLHIKQPSQNNLNRKITNFIDDGLFIWYSSNTKTNNIGSLMGYYVKGTDCFTFYLTLTKEKKWNVSKTIGLTRNVVEKILNTPRMRPLCIKT